jgi:quercetin dioxygenase-like cupin family protein
VVHIPGGVEHGAVALEDSVIADVFHPVREDFLAKVAQA